jgi:hypothetical protein
VGREQETRAGQVEEGKKVLTASAFTIVKRFDLQVRLKPTGECHAGGMEEIRGGRGASWSDEELPTSSRR